MTAIDLIKSMCKDTGFALEVGRWKRNHFNAYTKTIWLNTETFYGRTSADLACVAHECGHALQHSPVWLGVVWISRVALIACAALIYWFTGVAIGAAITILVIGKLGVLFMEFDASRRAYKFLKSTGQVNMKVVRKVLTRAWLTYLNIR